MTLRLFLGEAMPMRPYRLILVCLGLATAFCVGAQTSSPARADVEQPQNAAVNTPAAPPAAVLQVTDKAGFFTLSADHADVQSALKLLFDQGERQFVIDGSVSGQITMRLTGQPLPSVLNAICAQTFLRYQIDPNGVYHFTRNVEAVRAAFTRLRLLNGLLRQQLRDMGLDVPADAVLDARLQSQRARGGIPGAPGVPNGYSPAGAVGGLGGGGFGYAQPNLGSAQQGMEGRGPQSEETARKTNLNVQLNNRSAAQNEGAASLQNRAARSAKRQAADNADTLNVQAPVNGNIGNTLAYQQAVAQSNYVSFNIPFGKPLPMTDLLAQLGNQANVPILIDPDVPSGKVFRIDGKMSPRPLPDALNILSRPARLEWRWVGDKIFVTTAPDFQIYYGDSTVPRAGAFKPQSQMMNQNNTSSGPAGPSGSAKTDGEKPKPAKDK